MTLSVTSPKGVVSSIRTPLPKITFFSSPSLLVPPCLILEEPQLHFRDHSQDQDHPPVDPQLAVKQDKVFSNRRLCLGNSESNASGLDALNPLKLKDGSVVTRDEGNHCSVEFNLLDRVCAILSFL